MTIENLYLILKKNVEEQLVDGTSKLYTKEYDRAVFEYMLIAVGPEEWMERLNNIRDMERSISQFLVQQAMSHFNKSIVELT